MELFLPVAAGPAAAAPGAGHSTESVGGHVLVVEDETAVRLIATKFLQSLGFRVTSVDSAEAALAILDADRTLTTLFSDISLGAGMSGTELARRTRTMRPDVAVLLTTGFDREGVQADLHESTIPLLPKPYHRADLEKALWKLGRA